MKKLLPVLALSSLFPITAAAEDYFDPPGPPRSEASRMRTLNEVEPRYPIESIPVVITNPGAYFLPGSMDGSNDASGIVLDASDVTIDLNGFSLTGTTNSINGIEVTGQHQNIEIRNGVLRDWGGFGLMATSASDVVVIEVNAVHNGAGGLYTGPNSFLERCGVYANGFNAGAPEEPPRTDGIQCGAFSTVKDCKCRGNLGAGIHGYSHTRITGCSSTMSADADGIHLEDYCTVRDCVVAENKSNGIKVGSMCMVMENTAGRNGRETGGAGILVVGKNSLIEKNLTCDNAYGLRSEPTGAYGSLFLNNGASNNTSNDYDFGAGNYYGPDPEMTPGQIDSTNPWQNFRFSNK
ncbi:MAG: right-handed parallel beta-helix repeat-containing protein [Kiritimatiellia bacterium]